jgi:hypothetical protein
MKKNLLFTSILLLTAFISQAQWQQDVRLTSGSSLSYTTYYSNARCIASSGDTVHVVWSDNRNGGNWEIYYKRSTDGGISWGADTRISNNIYLSTNPSIAVSGSNIHVVWDDNRDGNNEIYYNRSTDGGISWGTDTRLSNDVSLSRNPCVSASGSAVQVVWNDYNTLAIFYKRSIDGGINWNPAIQLTNSPGPSWYPSVSESGSLVHILWSDGRSGQADIYYKRSEDGGETWGADYPLTNNSVTGYSDSPSMSVSGSVVQVVFRDTRAGGYGIYSKHSTDGGINWSIDKRVSEGNITEHCPSVSVLDSVVTVVWYGNRDGNAEIYYNHSSDTGQSWGTDVRLTNNDAISVFPFVAASNSAVHVVWQDYRDGNAELYYKRYTIGNTVGIKELSSAGMPVTIFPNPASTEIRIQSLENFKELTITDIYGKEIFHSKILNPKPELIIPVSDYPAGIYFIKVKNGNKIRIQKFIKQ